MDQSILLAKGLTKSFQNQQNEKLQVLKGITLEIPRGRITVIVGASGAGKSTLLHILSGLDHPDSGTVVINGENISALSDDRQAQFRNRNIGFIFQFHHLLPEFTALENIAIPMMIGGMPEVKANEKARELLNITGLSERAGHKPAELSGGEQQRVAVARALANDAEIIFADEPTGNLDSVNSQSINSLFAELRDKYNKTFVIVTHNPELVKLADVVFEIKDGLLLV
ncbi:MAG: ABC transporter ATP-binding protein [Bacteroidota bacterium]